MIHDIDGSTKHLAERENAAQARRRVYELESLLAGALARRDELERSVLRLEHEVAEWRRVAVRLTDALAAERGVARAT